MGKLWAGASKKEINPPFSLKLAGYLRRQGDTAGLHDPLELNLIWLEDGSTPLIFLTLDLLLFEDNFSQNLRHLLAEEMDLSPSSIVAAATHTHSAPAIHDFHGLYSRDQAWEEFLLATIVGAAREARNKARRAAWDFKKTEIKLAKNRRQENGPIDGFFPHLFIIDHRENPVALVAAYGCHPVCLDENNLLISADYVGAYRDQLRRYLGLDLPVLFFIGAAGDVNPPLRGSFEAAQQFSRELFAATSLLLKEMAFSPDIKLSNLEEKIELPLANPFSLKELEKLIFETETKLERARKKPDFLTTEEKMSLQAHLAWAKDLRSCFQENKLPKAKGAILTGIRFNQVPFLAHPFELFALLGQRLREKIDQNLFLLSYSHGYGGYLADEETALAGGYEIEEAYRFFNLLPLTRQADQIFLEAAIQIFERL